MSNWYEVNIKGSNYIEAEDIAELSKIFRQRPLHYRKLNSLEIRRLERDISKGIIDLI